MTQDLQLEKDRLSRFIVRLSRVKESELKELGFTGVVNNALMLDEMVINQEVNQQLSYEDTVSSLEGRENENNK